MTTRSPWLAALSRAPRRTASLLFLAALSCGKTQQEELPPLGEVVVSVDTNALVPQLIGRLRVDLFDQDGAWFDSRDIARNNPSDWPASFSVYTLDQKNPRTVLVRARAYLEGRTRDYLGERFEDRTLYVEPRAASTLDELCAAPPKLSLGQDLTLRSGRRPLTGNLPGLLPVGAPSGTAPPCSVQIQGGSVAAQLDISQAGDYQVKATLLNVELFGSDTAVAIRKDCREPLSQVACMDNYYYGDPTQGYYQTGDSIASVVTHLDVGSYSVIASGFYPTPVDFTLRADLAANANQAPPDSSPGVVGTLPRLFVSNVDITPAEEPQPLVTIDRLALLKLVPGKKQLAPIVLRMACSGLMAKLSQAASNAAPVLSEAETCVDTEGERVPLTEEALVPFDGVPTQSAVGSVQLGEACPEQPGPSGAVCVSAGAFVLGSVDVGDLATPTKPERFALMNRFWMDRTEVTVGRFRAALSKNFKSPNRTPVENNAPLVIDLSTDAHFLAECTFSAPGSVAVPREDFPLTCVDWYAARAFCQFEGGDLPTEAQWEYAASKAGRPFETRYPWGDEADAPTCAQAVFFRRTTDSLCASKGIGPAAVTDPSAQSDATKLGVLDLGGNVTEWVLDSYTKYDSPCWSGSTLTDPVCWEENAPNRSERGGAWSGTAITLATSVRRGAAPVGSCYNAGFFGNGHITEPLCVGWTDAGFRCVYGQEPK